MSRTPHDDTLEAPAPVIALHCSGASGGQWRALGADLAPAFELHAPSFIGCGDAGPWPGERAFTLLDEAQAIIEIVDAMDRPVHLVGHSYGGGVALKVASERPGRIASLSLYEPSAFHLLRQLGPGAAAELAEIEGIEAAVSFGLNTGHYQGAAAVFVEYWAGRGAWAALKPATREAMIHWLRKAPLDFTALLGDDTPLAAWRRLACPALVICGEHARGPSRRIAEEIARQLPNGTLEVLAGAGHMGPLTHAREVTGRLVSHLHSCEAKLAAARKDDALAA